MVQIQTQTRLINVKETLEEVRIKLKYYQWIQVTEATSSVYNERAYTSEIKVFLNVDHIIEVHEIEIHEQ